MRVVGIVAEYNPFHSGHEYQIRKAREIYGEDTSVIAVMSGNFVQRGEPAIAAKWVRTETALRCGVDLVIEIPFTFACASAERFAYGAISLLNATGVVTDLYFGSECDDLALLCCLSDEYDEENPVYVATLRENLRSGHSYAKSRELAVTALFKEIGRPELGEASAELMRMPNSILALEYLIAIRKTNSSIVPAVLRREGAGYLSCSTDSSFASATGIRAIVREHTTNGRVDISSLADALNGRMPDASLALLLSEWQKGIQPVLPSMFVNEQILRVRSQSAESLLSYAYMGDNLSSRLRNAVSQMRDTAPEQIFDTFRELSDTKRFAATRINRAMVSLLTGQLEKDLSDLSAPEYLRVLGFSERGRNLLRIMRKSATLPLMDKASDFLQHAGNSRLTRMAELDLISSEIWGLAAGHRYGDEFERRVIRLSKNGVVKIPPPTDISGPSDPLS
jgi:predicted nucleotidyltransferase